MMLLHIKIKLNANYIMWEVSPSATVTYW